MIEAFSRIRARLGAQGPRLIAITQRVFLVVALVVIAVYLLRNAGALRPLLSARTAFAIAAAAVLLALLHPLIGIAMFQLQRFFGISIDLAASLDIYMRRIPARYIPGGVWHSVARYADMKFDAGVGGDRLRKLFLAETALVATSGLVASGVGLAALPADSPIFVFSGLQMAGGVAVAVVALLLARRGAWRRIVAASLLMVLVWSGGAATFVLVASPLLDSGPSACPASAISATYLVAAVQGYLAIFAPQGWGVAEASFALLNTCTAPGPAIVGGFLLYRLSAIVGDVLGYASWVAVARRFLFRRGIQTRAD